MSGGSLKFRICSQAPVDPGRILVDAMITFPSERKTHSTLFPDHRKDKGIPVPRFKLRRKFRRTQPNGTRPRSAIVVENIF